MTASQLTQLKFAVWKNLLNSIIRLKIILHALLRNKQNKLFEYFSEVVDNLSSPQRRI